MRFPFGETVVRRQAARVLDPYSLEDVELNWNDVTDTPIAGCVVYPASTSEFVGVGRDQAEEVLTVLVPPGVLLDPDDRVLVRGIEYRVSGFTHQFHSPFTGWEPGGQATVTRTRG